MAGEEQNSGDERKITRGRGDERCEKIKWNIQSRTEEGRCIKEYQCRTKEKTVG